MTVATESTLVTLSEVRAIMDIKPAQEDAVARLLRGSIAQWEKRTRRLWERRENFEQTIVTDEGDQIIWPSLFPIETVTIEEFSRDEPTPVAVAADSFIVIPGRGQIERLSGSGNAPDGWLRFVNLTITGGYTSAEVGDGEETPAEVTEIILNQVKFAFERYSGGKIILSSEGFEGGSSNLLAADLHPQFKTFAKQMKRRV